MDRVQALTGRPTEALTFYMVLAFFKLAAIVEGADVPRLLRDAAHLAEAG